MYRYAETITRAHRNGDDDGMFLEFDGSRAKLPELDFSAHFAVAPRRHRQTTHEFHGRQSRLGAVFITIIPYLYRPTFVFFFFCGGGEEK